jgi:predicted transcriptional regulator of viral defense system
MGRTARACATPSHFCVSIGTPACCFVTFRAPASLVMEGSSRDRPYVGRNVGDPLDRRICERAASQHATIAVRQIEALGLSASAVRSRVARGRWYVVYPGVITVAPLSLLTLKGRIMAATLACRPGTAASHRSSSMLFELRLAGRRWIDVTTPGVRGHRRHDIRIHDGLTLTPADITVIDNIPCTTLARTLLDVCEDATRREVERALDVAEQRQRLDMTAIDDVLDRANGRRGAKLLRAVLDEHRVGSTLTRNDLEEAFLAIARAIEHPPDAVNLWIAFPDGGGAEADFVFRQERLIVEVDGRGTHATKRAFQTDRRRDQRLMLLGWRVVRFTWQQVTFEQSDVARTLRGLLHH